MSSHQSNKDKPRAAKCNHFCHPFDHHNYCPTCREAGKGDDPCVTLLSPCTICSSFTDEQLAKITHRKRYSKKSDKNKAEDIDAELLGDNSLESYGGSQAELKVAANRLFTSPPHPQPLSFEALSLRTPARTIPPTPGTSLQQKVQANLEKSLSSRFDIQMDQKMGAFQASMLEAFNNLREDFQKSLQKQGEVDQTSSASKTNAPSKDLAKPSQSSSALESMEVEYGPELPPRLDSYSSRLEDDSAQVRSSGEEPSKVALTKPKKSSHSSRYHVVDPSSASDHYSDYSVDPQPAPSRPKKYSDKSKHKSRARYLPSSSEEDQSPEHRHRSPKPSGKSYSDQDHPQHYPDPPYYREVALSDIPSQYAEEVDTFRRILKLPDPRESLPRSSTAVMGLDDEKGRQELRPRGPSSMLPLNSVIKDAFNKFDQDFQAAKLPEGKYIKPPPSTAKWYKVGQPCFVDKIQELNTDFPKICISPKPSGAPMGKVPMPILKELEHQARQNITTLNFATTFAKTSSSCNATLERCQHSLKATSKKVKSQIRRGADPEKAAKCGHEEACEYLELWNNTVLIQHRALTCLSKSLAHILQRELYSMGNLVLLRREAEMTVLQPHLGETRCQELKNASFWPPSLFKSQLLKEGEDFLLKKGTSKDSQGFGPYQNKPFRGPHKKRGSYRKRPYGGNSSQSSNQSFSSNRGKQNFRGSRGRFRPHNRGRGRGNPPSQ